MAGNSQRRGATRKPGSKKGPSAGTGGKNRRSLEGRGPTPKAEDRPYHVAAKRKAAAEKPGSTPRTPRPAVSRDSAARPSSARAGARQGGRGQRSDGGPEIVTGRNSVVEALRAGVPCTGVWVAHRIEADERVREILKAVTDRGLPLLEVTKPELDRLTDGLVHQGVAIQVPAYAYADLDAILARARRAGQPPLVVALDGVTDPRNLG
ncbi:MAG TPA: RNA methyltransferase substrate-binding domain-containing protein, partial [Actinotalea sp.]|nr:RNA methyltransferase substrate-binding domain-containing protein [Actinotalea sp.]